MDPLPCFLGLSVLLGVGSYFIIQQLDRKRMRDYFIGRGEVLISSDWQIIGPGWLGERDSRIYSVRYRDRNDKLHTAFVKTAMFSGVYVTDDRVMEFADPLTTREKLRAECKAPKHIVTQFINEVEPGAASKE